MSELDGAVFNEKALIVSNNPCGERLYLMRLQASKVASAVKPGQFVHIRMPQYKEHILRRPFSVYRRACADGTIDILYQEVGELTSLMPSIKEGCVEVLGPLGNSWDLEQPRHALLVGGGVGAAVTFLLAESLHDAHVPFDVVLGARTKQALSTHEDYSALMGQEPYCATDDGSFGHAGFCTELVEQRLQLGCSADGQPYDYIAVCGPTPVMEKVAHIGSQAGIRVQVSLERRMACGVGACLSCVVETKSGKRRSCADGPIFEADEVLW